MVTIYTASTLFQNTEQGFEWRQKFIKFLSEGMIPGQMTYEIIDPNVSTENRSYIDTALYDLNSIDRSDIIVGYVERPTFGTVSELMYAYSKCKIVYIISPCRVVREDLWVQFLSGRGSIFQSIKECAHHIRYMNNVINTVKVQPNV